MSAKTQTIKIIGHQAADGGWGVYSPHVRGVYGHGDSFADAVADWRRAADLYRATFGALVFTEDMADTADAVDTQIVSA